MIFSRLTSKDLELVRNWRNDSNIAQFMEYRGIITEKMQEKWFESINNEYNFYFILIYKNKKIGLINTKDIDYKNKTGEAGIFISDPNYQNSSTPFRASLGRIDFCFYELGLETLYAHVLSTNTRSIKFAQKFGYVIQSNQEIVQNQLYILTKEIYEMNKPSLLRYVD